MPVTAAIAITLLQPDSRPQLTASRSAKLTIVASTGQPRLLPPFTRAWLTPIRTGYRAPYITTLRNGTPSTVPAWNLITSNFIIANYNPSLAIDNDDGSSWYRHEGNFIVYGQAGYKSDFGAHNMHASGNYYAYVDVAWGGWPSIDGMFVNNSVILGRWTDSYFGYGYGSDCGLIGHPELGQIGANAVYAAAGQVEVACLNRTTNECSASCSLQDWVAAGHDHGTTVGPIPPDAAVITAAKALLGLRP